MKTETTFIPAAEGTGNIAVTGERIREARRSQTPYETQTDLAKALHVNRRTIANYENGGHIVPSDKLLTISQRYNVSVLYLLGITDKQDLKKG